MMGLLAISSAVGACGAPQGYVWPGDAAIDEGAVPALGEDGAASVSSPGNFTPSGPSDAGRPPRCDDAGHCTCITIASIGLPGHYGAPGGDNTDSFTSWLDTQSSASVDMYTTQPAITPAFLAAYDVVILQWMTAGNGGPYWTFSASEVADVEAWVRSGGGIVALSGYDSSSAEVVPLNQLLSFTDISYNMDNVLTTCPNNDPCYCWGNSVPLGGWVSDVIGLNIVQVGASWGRSINPGSATVDCPSPGTSTVFAAHEAIGLGHVVAYTDEWVTYTSQWLGTANANMGAAFTDASSPCYAKSAAEVFQVPQFWYNVLKYAASAAACPLTITNPTVIP
jgi:hypothetical protein